MDEKRLREFAGLNERAGDEKVDFIAKAVAKALGVAPSKLRIMVLAEDFVRFEIKSNPSILKKSEAAQKLAIKDPDGKRTWKTEIIDIRVEPTRSYARYEIQLQTSPFKP